MRKRWLLGVAATAGLAVAMQTGGCYYMQAMTGQLELMRKREPIPDVLADPDLPDAVRHKLDLVLEAREFSVAELDLPDNDSYRTYADLRRDFVVWNVFAAPEFSLSPKTWCFPVVGCVAYRGYFSEDAARRHAEKLAAEGFDTYVGGVPAYSTLGRFDDPVLNTMMRWTDVDLVATLFHELAHQRLFVKGDTAFNESFATAVAEAGLERWLTERGAQDELARYRRRDRLRQALRELADAALQDLGRLYASSLAAAEKRRRKELRLATLVEDAEARAAALGFRDAGWLRQPLNNARLASVSLYRGYLPAFRSILDDCAADLRCFYSEAEKLAGLDAAAREAILLARMPAATPEDRRPPSGY